MVSAAETHPGHGMGSLAGFLRGKGNDIEAGVELKSVVLHLASFQRPQAGFKEKLPAFWCTLPGTERMLAAERLCV